MIQVNENLDLQKKRFIMLGGNIEHNVKKVSSKDIEKLKRCYKFMYAGFVCLNWSNGCKLGVAWQKALEQMEAFIKSKTKIKNHPLNQELLKIHAEFRRKMSEYIMKNQKHAQSTVQGAEAKNFLDLSKYFMKKSRKRFDNMYKKYMPEQIIKETPMSKSFGVAKQNVQKLIVDIEKQKMIALRQITMQKVA